MVASKPVWQIELLTTFLVSAPLYLTQISRIPPPFLPLTFYLCLQRGSQEALAGKGLNPTAIMVDASRQQSVSEAGLDETLIKHYKYCLFL